MATLNYKQIINLATTGFKNIQNAIYNLSADRPSEITQVTSATAAGVETHTGNVTPATMATAITKLATIKISNTSTNNVSTKDGYITGQVKYNNANITKNPSLSGTTVSYEQTLTGYYPGVKISGSLNLGAGKVTIGGGALSAPNLDASEEPTGAFKADGVVTKSNATTTGYSYAKISRSGVSASITAGYIAPPVSSSNITNNAGSSDTAYYVKIQNAAFTKTDAAVNLSADLDQAEYVGTTNQNTADLNVLETTRPGAGIGYYMISGTPSIASIPTKGTVKASTAGYAALNAGKTDVSVTENSAPSTDRYIIKSTLSTSANAVNSPTASITWATKTVTIARGYYPTNRTISLSMNTASATITNNMSHDTTKYYDGSNNANVTTEILKSNTNGLTKYYTVKFNSSLGTSNLQAGYLENSNNITLNGGSLTRYIPELAATIGADGGNTTFGYTQSNTTGTLLSKLDDGSSNVGSGIVLTAPSGKTEGTDYWRVEAKGSGSTISKTVTATVTVDTAGYKKTGTLGSTTATVTAAGRADGNYRFYVTKPTFNAFTVNSGSTSLNCSKPIIKLNAAGNGANSTIVNGAAAQTSKPSSGYFIAVKSDALSTAATGSITMSTKTSAGGYLPINTTIVSSGTTGISATYPESDITYIPITTGVAKNGYVTTSGWIPQNTQVYTLSYDSDEECVDFIFNE